MLTNNLLTPLTKNLCNLLTPLTKTVVNYILENSGAYQCINTQNYFPLGSLLQYIYCLPKGGTFTPVCNHPKDMQELYLLDYIYLCINIVEHKHIRIPFKKIVLEFGLQHYQPLLKIHTLVLNGYNLGLGTPFCHLLKTTNIYDENYDKQNIHQLGRPC